jgi:hypothetical protein
MESATLPWPEKPEILILRYRPLKKIKKREDDLDLFVIRNTPFLPTFTQEVPNFTGAGLGKPNN